MVGTLVDDRRSKTIEVVDRLHDSRESLACISKLTAPIHLELIYDIAGTDATRHNETSNLWGVRELSDSNLDCLRDTFDRTTKSCVLYSSFTSSSGNNGFDSAELPGSTGCD